MNKLLEASKSIDRFYRLERKLVLNPFSSDFIMAWLNHTCIPDARYPASTVHSLYFDTPDLDSYYECLNGDMYKNKIRLRWYDTPEQDTLTAYLEVKSKQGFQCDKRRKPVTIPNISKGTQCCSLDSLLRMEQELSGLGYVPVKKLSGTVLISYRRNRFYDRSTGLTISYDTDIESHMVGNLASCRSNIKLENTVIELKGTGTELPRYLTNISMLDARYSSFSKYGNCLNAHLRSG